MPKRNSRKAKRPKRPTDVNQLAHLLVKESTGNEAKANTTTAELISQVMREMGRKGGKIGGKRRLTTLSKARRSEIARNAAQERWKRHNDFD